MDHLWSPWRYRYVSAEPASDKCIFCEKARADANEQSLVVYRGARNYILLNLYPYTNGHLMVAPYEHVASLEDLCEETSAELMALTRRAVKALRGVYHPHGLNLGMNLGECAGAGVAGHLHMHVLPRWYGDASFMTTVGETRVLPEDLTETWRRVKAALDGEAG
jgi:ATP adenylyltransferase